jgi:hypothetical protein
MLNIVTPSFVNAALQVPTYLRIVGFASRMRCRRRKKRKTVFPVAERGQIQVQGPLKYTSLRVLTDPGLARHYNAFILPSPGPLFNRTLHKA